MLISPAASRWRCGARTRDLGQIVLITLTTRVVGLYLIHRNIDPDIDSGSVAAPEIALLCKFNALYYCTCDTLSIQQFKTLFRNLHKLVNRSKQQYICLNSFFHE